jgi:hypothetical protein
MTENIAFTRRQDHDIDTMHLTEVDHTTAAQRADNKQLETRAQST